MLSVRGQKAEIHLPGKYVCFTPSIRSTLEISENDAGTCLLSWCEDADYPSCESWAILRNLQNGFLVRTGEGRQDFSGMNFSVDVSEKGICIHMHSDAGVDLDFYRQ